MIVIETNRRKGELLHGCIVVWGEYGTADLPADPVGGVAAGRLFKKTTGKSYKAYIKDLKLEYASSLLRATSLPIIEIAGHCGYATLSHFNREFKTRYGVPPTHFRKKA